jgi:tRNA(Ile)-lysidine synthase
MNADVLLERLSRTLDRLGLRGHGLVVGVSGGPDSVALLLLLASLGVRPLVVAHLNHQLRGPESDADEAFVRRLHASLVEQGHPDLRLCCSQLDVAAIAEAEGENLEGTARQERYRWLAEVARQQGLHHVATGHTLDDQAETVLHRLLRGAGLQGLRGIAERRPLADDVELVRPILDVSRAEVLAFLQEAGISACEDSSNVDLKYTRNRIRHQLLPYLEEHFNPAVRAILNRLAREADEVFLEEQADVLALLSDAELPRTQSFVVLRRETLARSRRRRVRLLFRHLWQREDWPTGDMTFAHWQRLEALVFDDLIATDLPGGIHARRRDQVIQLGKRV